ncbi:MAG TPA: WD40 repeat domain-containing protein, partial [Archangium sp.]|nr:WD40 repeat domain-containing protein [Archangium sp.]
MSGGRLVGSFQHQGPVNGVAFSPDGKWLATAAGGDATANVFEVAGGKRLVSMPHRGDVMAVAF